VRDSPSKTIRLRVYRFAFGPPIALINLIRPIVSDTIRLQFEIIR